MENNTNTTKAKPADRWRGKGAIQQWGQEESKNGNPVMWFRVVGDQLAPPDTYDDADFSESEVWSTRVSMTLVEGKTDWVFATLQQLLGEKEVDLDRFDPEHPEAYDLEGREVTVNFKNNEYNGTIRLQSGFIFPRKKGKLSKFGAELMAFRQRQLEDEAAK